MNAHRFRRYSVCLALGLMAFAQANAQDTQPIPVTRAQFAGLSWLIGSWRGSGGQYPAFFEDYRLLNDSTILQRTLSDSTFKTASDSSEIALRGGAVRSGKAGVVRYVVTRISKDSVQFSRRTGSGGGFGWAKVSDSQWNAVLEPGRGQTAPTVYQMRRVKR